MVIYIGYYTTCLNDKLILPNSNFILFSTSFLSSMLLKLGKNIDDEDLSILFGEDDSRSKSQDSSN